MSTKRIDAYEIYCDGCGTQHDSGEFTIWVDASQGVEDAVASDWFERTESTGSEPPSEEFPRGRSFCTTVELLCPRCKTCDVCRAPDAYEVDDHLVCEDHEDHDFTRGGGPMRPIQRKAIDSYLDAYGTCTLTVEVVGNLMLAINDPELRRWLIAVRKYERGLEVAS